MKAALFAFLILLLLACTEKKSAKKITTQPQAVTSIPPNVQKLLKNYTALTAFKDNKLYFSDDTYLLYNDGKEKNYQQLLDHPDIEDQFRFNYPKGRILDSIAANNDPGRIRNDEFFKKIYGSTKEKVEANLVEITWCPKLVGQKIKVTRINNVDAALKKIAAELDNHPELKEYISHIAGTFVWRNINGSNRQSMHSYGMTIDINVAYANYWQWDCKCENENAKLPYKNRIPQMIVAIFEKYGFIWGGKWYHYDTMHFEYRPELID